MRTKFEHTLEGLLGNTTRLDNGCMIWNGAKRSSGYGSIQWGDKNTTTSRVVLELVYGKQGNDIYACHTCDNPSCINPEHLFPATNSDNLKDAQQKGRMRTAQHGTRAKYVTGCKCESCLKAEADYARNRRHESKLTA
jgi:hypothetical protein